MRKETAMEIFTDVEKLILKKTNKSYKWIARDKNGELCIYERKPFREVKEGREYFGTLGKLNVFDKCFSDVLFKNVTWENSPIQYRNDELLTSKEREYLKFVFRPFVNHIAYVRKSDTGYSEFIEVGIYKNYSMLFPNFKKGTMYKGMKPEKSYTLKELGIEYDE